MKKRIVINPLTRISGFLEIDVQVENHVITSAKTKGNMFRGFEQMMVGRNPYDAIYLTQRICGICSTAHSVGSSLALEDAMLVKVSEEGRYLRDIIHGCEFLQNHLRHFYQYTVPDYAILPEVSQIYHTDYRDFRLPKKVNDELVAHYFEALPMSRLAHQMLAVMGGKAPHNHGIFVGGVATPPTADQIIQMKSILQSLSAFIETKAIPDVYTIAKYYDDYYQIGKGPGHLMSFGVFHQYKSLGTLYVDPLIYQNGEIRPFKEKNITESIERSWYDGKKEYAPLEEMSEPNMDKPRAYSWVKAPRYNGHPFEVGPLARLWLSGKYQRGISTMDRTIARVLELKVVADVLRVLLNQIHPNISLQKEWELPEQAIGAGLVDTTRGALGHWLKMENRILTFYQIITPSAWDFSPQDAHGVHGTAEQALIGTTIQDLNQPIEIGRILRSFDPCMSCATHVYSPGLDPFTIQVFG
ncbi:nickel-dependent hydrogenase large subunit [Ammoniphilus sp. CFH 90114]|uniref:nickel-dependent hydrogenase large subunit n=1 Tax=Ammoniphilus sp. CFH 90114 TaxID=2493665 RepID=UPI00100F6AE2|nr:nickel-dependent hydrogenase large subunit [Ammoniphilus sp. CFH 90114]RXT07948.1 Ni/Fe hydrogenase [Ammoniphilus sp. CFH 90114]